MFWEHSRYLVPYGNFLRSYPHPILVVGNDDVTKTTPGSGVVYRIRRSEVGDSTNVFRSVPELLPNWALKLDEAVRLFHLSQQAIVNAIELSKRQLLVTNSPAFPLHLI